MDQGKKQPGVLSQVWQHKSLLLFLLYLLILYAHRQLLCVVGAPRYAKMKMNMISYNYIHELSKLAFLVVLSLDYSKA